VDVERVPGNVEDDVEDLPLLLLALDPARLPLDDA
jgi:hypothetical protein